MIFGPRWRDHAGTKDYGRLTVVQAWATRDDLASVRRLTNEGLRDRKGLVFTVSKMAIQGLGQIIQDKAEQANEQNTSHQLRVGQTITGIKNEISKP